MATAPREAWGDLATTAFVEASHLFKSLDPDARRDLLQVATVVTFSAGEPISGDAAEGFCLVVAGAAAAAPGPAAAGEGGRLERGAFLGEALVLGAPRRSAFVAVDAVTLVVFPPAVIAAISERFPKVRKLLEAVRAARERDAGQPGS